ncbi:prostaglandin F2 receptor negative regulator [Callorhinchus milii]|uniref:prostaglandin F2 receptor negative regulator n=1 Tax=Callorhinchus milii TaxID=7868 RepID=UPI001C3FACAC|nr:prostaglandin F2 receptor negative regulator [Callorhinchus milii]XP_042190080.1 prostaglandin F2 receptor negative regulator [Callorhinchus milii]
MERLLWLLVAMLNFGLSSGRIVKVPSGPLYRVLGSSVDIPCSVSEYQGPAEQNFDWTVLRGDRSVKIDSTWEPNFFDPEYKEKVTRREITVQRLSNNSTQLHFTSVTFQDEGQYTCETPSTDENSAGNYDAQVYLKVIPDGLTVTLGKSRSIKSRNYTEGESLELQCIATTTSTIHTHVAITWRLKSEESGTMMDILSLTAKGKLKSGDQYKDRYESGDVRMSIEESGVYKLLIDRLRPEDQGTYLCVAEEWVMEDVATWKNILEKNTDIASIKVRSLAEALAVSTFSGNLTLNKESNLNLSCLVTGVEDLAVVEVGWYFSSSLPTNAQSQSSLVYMDRTAVVNNSNSVTLSKISSNEYRLRVQQVDETDSGYYYCTASVWIRGSSGTWKKAAEKTSNSVPVRVSFLDSSYSVKMNLIKGAHSFGDSAVMECQVVDVQNLGSSGMESPRLTVSWYFKPEKNGSDWVNIPLASMNEELILTVDNEYKERAEKGELIFTKSQLNTFRFQIQQALISDKGEYFCKVSAWVKHRDDSRMKSKTVASDPVIMSWQTQVPSLNIKATGEKPVSTRGNTFEMTCSVSSKHVTVSRYSVVIAMKEPTSPDANDIKTLISLSRDSVVQLETWDTKDRSEDVILEKVSDNEFRFRLFRTQFADEGMYYCMVQAWIPDTNGGWLKSAANSSNTVSIAFKTAAPWFNVTLESDKHHVLQGETVQINCVIDLLEISKNTDVFYEVEWLASEQLYLNTSLLVSIDQKSVVTHAKGNMTTSISAERISEHEFCLRIHCAEKRDAKFYYCAVTPWIKSEIGDWQKMSQQTSDPLAVRVNISVLDSFKMPLIYGITSTLIVGILACAIGWCTSQCCCREEKRGTRRENRKLIQMEMD